MEEKREKIDYVKPEILDLGLVTPAQGLCEGYGYGAADCSPAGSSPSICSNGGSPAG